MRSLEIEHELEARVAELGFECVDVRWGGSSRRPVLRVRVDSPDSVPGVRGISVGECAVVSRALESWLDAREDLPAKYVLEVSSPGVDRPLIRPRDFRRFAGEQVAIKGHEVLAGRARRLEGELLGLDTDDGTDTVHLRLSNGDEVRIPRDKIAGANLVFTWK